MLEHVLNARDFLEAAKEGVVLDVRSPKEFEEGHIPGAVSFPLFTDDERAVVGTTYKRIGKSEAIDAGLSFVGPKLQSLATQARALFEAQSDPKPLLIYCWRGGMRSGSVDWLLRTAQIPSQRCEGGYKACRAVYNEVLEADRPYVVVGGMTGSAKTEVLHALREAGESVLDLEGLARHYGSAFGNLDDHPQPSTAQFSNLLARALMDLDAKQGGGPIWVENESRQIGKVHMPETFHKRQRSAPVLEIERTEEDRVNHLLSMYGGASTEALVEAFERIRTKLGGQHANEGHCPCQRGRFGLGSPHRFGLLRQTYRHGLDQREAKPVDGRGCKPDDIAQRCMDVHNEWNPWNLKSN